MIDKDVFNGALDNIFKFSLDPKKKKKRKEKKKKKRKKERKKSYWKVRMILTAHNLPKMKKSIPDMSLP